MNKTIESFMYMFLKSLFTDGDTERALSFFAEDALCTGYLGNNSLNSVSETGKLFIFGVSNGLVNLRCEDVECRIIEPASESLCVLAHFSLVDNNDSYRRMKKRATLLLSQKESGFDIRFADFELLSQTGFLEFMYLDVVNESLRKELIRSKQRFDVAIQHTSLSLWEYDIKERAIYQKDNSVEMHGFDIKVENVPDSLIESKFVHPQSAGEFRAMYERLFAGEKQAEGVFRVLNPERTKYWWEKITYITEYDDEGAPVRAIGFSTDVSEHVEAQQQLKRISLQKQTLARNALFTAIFDLTADRVLDMDTNSDELKELKEITQCSKLGEHFINKYVAPSHRDDIKDLIDMENVRREYDSGNRTFQSEYLHVKSDDETIWAMLFMEVETDENTGHLTVNCYVENIHKQKQKELKMKNDAELDPLTMTYNRLAFKVLMESLLSRAIKGHLSVFGLMDIDDFKTFNDEKGHIYGDAVLVRVVEIFKRCFRQDDIIGRLGGDEFVFLMDNVVNIEFIKKKLHRLYRELHSIDEHVTAPICVSIGIAIAPWDGNDFETLYSKADIALYSAKRSGKNRWCIYQES